MDSLQSSAFYQLLFKETVLRIQHFNETGGVVTSIIFFVSVMIFWQAFHLALILMFTARKERIEFVSAYRERHDNQRYIQKWLMGYYQTCFEIQYFSKLKFMALLVMLCPLLGLLGTVIGMVTIFDSLSNWGMSKPEILATAISKAILPTLSGMAVAAVGLFVHFFMKRWVARNARRLHILLLKG